MRVKICGITNLEDALYATECGTDALGFLFFEGSPRYIKPSDAKKIIQKLPPFIKTYGLFVNASADEINEAVRCSGVDIAQIHFEASSELLEAINGAYIEVIRAQTPEDILSLKKDRYYLIDSFTPEYGGSGKRLNLEWFKNLDCSKFILAGGLSAQNLNELDGFNFLGVDVSSGVEAKKRIKCKDKVKHFIDKAKSL